MTTRSLRAALAAALLAALPAAAQEAWMEGTVRYEKVPATLAGLRVSEAFPAPAAGVRVEAVSAAGEVLAAGFADAKGRYALALPLAAPAAVRLRAVARTANAEVVGVEDRRRYVVESTPVRARPGERVRVDLLAPERGRRSGAFNLAVTIERANAFLRAADPGVDIPQVEVRWDTAYVGGTFFRSRDRAAYINGLRSRDSDEFDDHVILHEYAHFLMAAMSREGSPGGDHGTGERLDPRLAWSEGWANFFAAAVLGDPRYVDTGVVAGRQGVRVTMDLENNLPPRDDPGIWSEATVASLLWDWYDEGDEVDDPAALGFRPMWEAFVSLRKVPDPYLLDFAEALARRVKDPRQVAAGMLARGIDHPPGEDPPAAKPFPGTLARGIRVTGAVDSRATRRSNLWGSSAFYAFVLPEDAEVTVQMKILDARERDCADLDLFLFDEDGERLGSSDAVNGVGATETITRRLPAGYYRVEVRSWSNPSDGRIPEAGANEGTFSLLLRY